MIEVWTTNWLGLRALDGLRDTGVAHALVVWPTSASDAVDPAHADVVVYEPPEEPVAGGRMILVAGWPKLIHTTQVPVIGFHPSPLPIGRGRAPIPHTILMGLTHSAVCLFRATAEADAGPIIVRREFPVGEQWTARDLYAEVGTQLRIAVRDWAEHGLPVLGREQDHARATVWPRRTPADSEIPPDADVDEAHRMVRALDGPYPAAFVQTPDGCQRLRSAGRIHRSKWAGAVQLDHDRLYAPGGSFQVVRAKNGCS